MQYSQLRALWSITIASLRAISRSPSAVVFSFAFPFVFIIVFGFIGNSGAMQTYKVAFAEGSDTTSQLYRSLRTSGNIQVIDYADKKELTEDLEKGRIAGIISIQKNDTGVPYRVSLKSASSSNNKWPQLLSIIESRIHSLSDSMYQNRPAIARLDFNYDRDVAQIRQFKTIDFILPGQLGFSLLSSGVFGVAFMFFNLRSTLVLKRFFATPVSRTSIILGEGLARVIFNMITAIVIILVGYFFFGYTLIYGAYTLLQMLALSFIGLLLFMGFGFIVSGLATSDSSIPPFANLITLPQFLLGGTFFSIEAFPSWLQPLSHILPLTHLNSALRKVAFEGQNLWDVRIEILILIAWSVVVYAFAVKTFKWER